MKKIILGILFCVLFLLTSLASIRVIVRVSQDESKAFEDKVGHCVGSALVPTFFLALQSGPSQKNRMQPALGKITKIKISMRINNAQFHQQEQLDL
ncbi:hypothetical protein [Gimesia chilikensis]|uniref:hypothetical protein n=1 Tax=Gimesia chilikensis TaxID=2605989 RepID=UPI003A8CD75E